METYTILQKQNHVVLVKIKPRKFRGRGSKFQWNAAASYAVGHNNYNIYDYKKFFSDYKQAEKFYLLEILKQ
jgi:hypothetical protein